MVERPPVAGAPAPHRTSEVHVPPTLERPIEHRNATAPLVPVGGSPAATTPLADSPGRPSKRRRRIPAQRLKTVPMPQENRPVVPQPVVAQPSAVHNPYKRGNSRRNEISCTLRTDSRVLTPANQHRLELLEVKPQLEALARGCPFCHATEGKIAEHTFDKNCESRNGRLLCLRCTDDHSYVSCRDPRFGKQPIPEGCCKKCLMGCSEHVGGPCGADCYLQTRKEFTCLSFGLSTVTDHR